MLYSFYGGAESHLMKGISYGGKALTLPHIQVSDELNKIYTHMLPPKNSPNCPGVIPP